MVYASNLSLAWGREKELRKKALAIGNTGAGFSRE